MIKNYIFSSFIVSHVIVSVGGRGHHKHWSRHHVGFKKIYVFSNPIHCNTKCHHYFHWHVAPVCWIVKLDLKFLPRMHLQHLTVLGVTEGISFTHGLLSTKLDVSECNLFSIIQCGRAFEELVSTAQSLHKSYLKISKYTSNSFVQKDAHYQICLFIWEQLHF